MNNGEQAVPAPPTDEPSEVLHAYQSGEQLDDRPASALAGVQSMLSSEGVGVGADTISATVTVHAHGIALATAARAHPRHWPPARFVSYWRIVTR